MEDEIVSLLDKLSSGKCPAIHREQEKLSKVYRSCLCFSFLMGKLSSSLLVPIALAT